MKRFINLKLSPFFCKLMKRGVILASFLVGGLFYEQSLAENAVKKSSRSEIEAAMKKATRFMVEKVSHKGGYVWSYLPDFSRRWGEMEAYESMVWVQAPGTSSMGHLFLDAYHATGDIYYYDAALKVASALITGQHKSGGWNYFIDFAGERSIRRWYRTIGYGGWRLEEFHHYYGNATFDDSATIEAAEFILRLHLESASQKNSSAKKAQRKIKKSLDKAIDFVLQSQYPIGGWPQRYPKTDTYSSHGLPDYSGFITFNDDVAAANIHFLSFYYQSTGDKRVLDAITRAMNVFLVTHQGPPQPGWAMQYTLDLQPVTARTYEPKSLSPLTTYRNIGQLLNFYEMTGETKFIARIPETIAWLKSMAINRPEGTFFPLVVEVDTNRVLYVHRRGSNTVNGEYYVDYNPEPPLGHYGGARLLDLTALTARYDSLLKLSREELTRNSPLKITQPVFLPAYYTLAEKRASDLNARTYIANLSEDDKRLPQALIGRLNEQGYWPTPLKATSHPYIGPGPMAVTPGDYSGTRVGDKYDTSPFYTDEPELGISTGVYIYNMSRLIEVLLKEGA